MKRHTLARSASILALSFAAAAGLAACKKDQPTAAQGIPSPVAPGPDALADAGAPPPTGAAPLPVTRTRAAPSDRYAYLDQAYYMRDVLGDAPPDYAFDYDGVEPWVWQSSTRDELLYEPYDGGWREYYYRPGDDYPYLVRDPTYSYAYDDGVLAAIYGAGGALLPYDQWAVYAPAAGRYFTRGEALYRAAQTAPRQAVAPQQWQSRAPQVRAAEAALVAAQGRDADWRTYHDAHVQQAQAYWRPEVDRRRSGAPVQIAQLPRSPVYAAPAFQAGPPPADRVAEVNRARQAQENARIANAAARTQQVQADRFAAEQGRAAAMQARHQAEDAQRAAAEQRRLVETNARVQQAQRAQAEQGRRQAEQAQRQAEHQAEQDRHHAEQAQRQAEHQAEQAQRQAEQAQRAQAEQAQRAQAEAGRRQAEAAQRAQAEQAQRAQQEAGRRQAEAAQRAQADAARQQQQAQAEAARHQQEAQAQAQRAQQQAQHGQAEQARQPPAGDKDKGHGNGHGEHGRDKG